MLGEAQAWRAGDVSPYECEAFTTVDSGVCWTTDYPAISRETNEQRACLAKQMHGKRLREQALTASRAEQAGLSLPRLSCGACLEGRREAWRDESVALLDRDPPFHANRIDPAFLGGHKGSPALIPGDGMTRLLTAML